jgi:hypothetical protein
MYQLTQIRQTLQPHLSWHGARIAFLALFLVALFRVKTVNLSALAVGCNPEKLVMLPPEIGLV